MGSPPDDLSGRCILVTRAPHQAAAMQDAIIARGGRPVSLSVVQVVFDTTDVTLDAGYDRIIFTSVNAITAVMPQIADQVISTPVICVGEKTRAALPSAFVGEVQTPEVFRAEGVIELLGDDVRGRRFFVPRAEHGREVLVEALEAHGAIVDAPIVYRMVNRTPPSEELAAAEEAQFVTFLSGATLAAFIDTVGSAYLEGRVTCFIGPVAAEMATKMGVRVDIVAERATIEDLLDAISLHPVRSSP